MLHLDQHSALPPESIMGCDNTPPFFSSPFYFFLSMWMMQLLLEPAADGDGNDYDEWVVQQWIENLLLKFDVYSSFD